MARRTLFIGISLAFALGVVTMALTAMGDFVSYAAPAADPQAIDLHPAANSHTAPLTTAVSITYDQPISPTSVTSRTLVIQAGQTGLITGVYSVAGGAISLTPSRPFMPGEMIQASATTSTWSIGGQEPVSPTVWHFRAAASGGSGTFRSGRQVIDHGPSAAVALGDVDGDGDLDALIGNLDHWNDDCSCYTGGEDMIWLNDRQGNFVDSGQRLSKVDTYDISLGDLDGDGDLDALISGDMNSVWFNDGDGVYIDSGQSLTPTKFYSYKNALGDLDGDGDLDAYITELGPDTIWFNDGQGIFTKGGQTIGEYDSYDVALGDVDGDGDLDVVLGNSARDNDVWLNDGHGFFTDSGQQLGPTINRGIALGDLDGDGDLDAFLPVLVESDTDNDQVWFNDGNGTFSDSGQRLSNGDNFDANLVDLDGDGDLDAFVGKFDCGHAACDPDRPLSNEIWLNDGAGFFVDSGQRLGDGGTFDLALGDVDSDGDIDALAANVRITGNEIWINDPLRITKTGPDIVIAGDPITYTLAVTNLTNITQTNLVITDALPPGASYITGGTLIDGATVSWTFPSLAPSKQISMHFVVTASTNITNSLYAVTTAGGHESKGDVPVVTQVDGPISGLQAFNNGPVGLGSVIILTASITTGNNATYLWDFGDGEIGSGAVVTHVYPAIGTYTATVTAGNSVNTVTITTTVLVIAPVQLYFPIIIGHPLLIRELPLTQAPGGSSR